MAKGFEGLWIPASIMNDSSLCAAEKIILGEVHSLQGDRGCFASNAHFAKRVGVGDRQVRNYLAQLLTSGHIWIDNHGTRRRKIRIASGKVPTAEPSVAPDTAAAAEAKSGRAVPDSNGGESGSVLPDAGNTVPANVEADCRVTRQQIATEITSRRQEKNTIKTTHGIGIDIPEGLPAAAWQKWVEYRSRRGTPKPAVLQADLERLIALDRDRNTPADVIARSIERGWQGLFELPADRRPTYHTTMSGQGVRDPKPHWAVGI